MKKIILSLAMAMVVAQTVQVNASSTQPSVLPSSNEAQMMDDEALLSILKSTSGLRTRVIQEYPSMTPQADSFRRKLFDLDNTLRLSTLVMNPIDEEKSPRLFMIIKNTSRRIVPESKDKNGKLIRGLFGDRIEFIKELEQAYKNLQKNYSALMSSPRSQQNPYVNTFSDNINGIGGAYRRIMSLLSDGRHGVKPNYTEDKKSLLRGMLLPMLSDEEKGKELSLAELGQVKEEFEKEESKIEELQQALKKFETEKKKILEKFSRTESLSPEKEPKDDGMIKPLKLGYIQTRLSSCRELTKAYCYLYEILENFEMDAYRFVTSRASSKPFYLVLAFLHDLAKDVGNRLFSLFYADFLDDASTRFGHPESMRINEEIEKYLKLPHVLAESSGRRPDIFEALKYLSKNFMWLFKKVLLRRMNYGDDLDSDVQTRDEWHQLILISLLRKCYDEFIAANQKDAHVHIDRDIKEVFAGYGEATLKKIKTAILETESLPPENLKWLLDPDLKWLFKQTTPAWMLPEDDS